MSRIKSDRRPLLRTPSQLYQFVKPSSSSLQSQNEDSLLQIIGPEFVVRSKERPLTLCLLKKNGKEISHKTKMKKVTVVKLSGERFEVTCDPNATSISHLFEAVTTEEEKRIMHYLGLAKLTQGEIHFIPSRTKLHKIAPKGWKKDNEAKCRISIDNFTLYLRFVLYPQFQIGIDEESLLLNQLYLQYRHDLINGLLFIPASELLRLAAYALRVEFGNVRKDEYYFMVEHFLPRYFIASRRPHLDLRSDLHDLHSGLSSQGVSRNDAKQRYVLEAQSLTHAGTHFYLAFSGCNKYWLGANKNGLYLLEEPPSVQSLAHEDLHAWDSVTKLSKGSSRNLILHFECRDEMRKMKFAFRQRDGCSSILRTFKTLRSFHRESTNNSRGLCQLSDSGCIPELPEMTENLFPETVHENGSCERSDKDSSVMSSTDTRANDVREKELEKSFRFKRYRGCRNWWKKSSGLLIGGRNSSKSSSSSSSLNSFLDGQEKSLPEPDEKLAPEQRSDSPEHGSDSPEQGSDSTSHKSSQHEEFKRFVDESFSMCETPLREKIESQNDSVNIDHSVIQRIQSTSLVTQTSIVADSNKFHQRILAWQPVRETQSAQSIQVTQSTQANSPLSPSVIPYSSVPLHSPTRTSLGVRMGTRVPNALINKHKFLGIDSPPATPCKMSDSAAFTPCVIETSSSPCGTSLNETVSESLLSRFMRAPSHPEGHERRLTTVTLKRKNGLLGILVGVGADTALYVQGITPGGPAEEQGMLKPGDRFVGVNGLCVDSLPYGHTIEFLRKAPDDEVCLVVSQLVRDNNQSPVSNDVSTDDPLPFIESQCSNATGKYVTVIPISTSNEEEACSPNPVSKRLLFLYHEQV